MDGPTATAPFSKHDDGLIQEARLAALRALLDALPREAANEDPELAISLAAAYLMEGRLEQAATYIEVAERSAAAVAAERRRGFRLRLASTRLWLARFRDELSTVEEAMRSIVAALAGPPPGASPGGGDHLAATLLKLGTAEFRSLRAGDGLGHLEQPPRLASALASQASVLLWRGQLAEAEVSLKHAQRLVNSEQEAGTARALQYAIGLLRFGQGRQEDALFEFQEAVRLATPLGEDAVFDPPGARMAQVWALKGNTNAARAALAELDAGWLSRPPARIARAAIHLAEGEPQRAIETLRSVVQNSEGATRSLPASIEALSFEAAAHDELGDTAASRLSLEQALDLAEPDGILLPFALAPVQSLLERLPRHETKHPTLVTAILDLFADSSLGAPAEAGLTQEELSPAELRVARYLPTNLNAPEIAAELFVSPNTVRTHMRHIYSKLGAHSRREAVDRARELRLLAPSLVP